MAEKVIAKFSKLDVARRQLETATRLYFSFGDPVSIHTLVGAAYQILRDLNRKHDGQPMLKDNIPTWVRPEDREKAVKKINEAENFFKHADRDHAEVLEFRQEPTELLLFEACAKYHELSGENVPVLQVYQSWFPLVPGAGFKFNPELEQAREGFRRAMPNTRQSFFAELLPIISTFKTT